MNNITLNMLHHNNDSLVLCHISIVEMKHECLLVIKNLKSLGDLLFILIKQLVFINMLLSYIANLPHNPYELEMLHSFMLYSIKRTRLE